MVFTALMVVAILTMILMVTGVHDQPSVQPVEYNVELPPDVITFNYRVIPDKTVAEVFSTVH
jgi:hypothetical protein